MRTNAEIESQIDKAMQAEMDGSSGGYSGMSYEEGVRAALEWVTETTDELPME